MEESGFVPLPPLSPAQREEIRRGVDLFERKDYSGAAGAFAALRAFRPSDYRLSHNLIVADFWGTGCRGIDRFYDHFLAILNKVCF